MKSYRFINNLAGWIVFAIAAIVYCMTIEPTASFWDCPEFISTAHKLEIGHPPGAPFWMLTGNFFTQFASDTTQVAKMVNYMSALTSAACILFLFWSITHLTRKLIVKDGSEISMSQIVTIIASGAVGALAYTFSDTFWFSAVEGEVYAYSSLFTAVVFWLILKWEDNADKPHADKWLVLICYLTGLSIGVHLLNLLCIPAIVLVYYFKKKPDANGKGSLLALIGSAVLIGIVLYGIVPGITKVGGVFDLFFVNTLGMSFNSGFIVYAILLSALIIWGVYETYVNASRSNESNFRSKLAFLLTFIMLGIPFYGKGTSSLLIGLAISAVLAIVLFTQTFGRKISARLLNTTMICLMMMVIGYSSYAVIVIRSTANTPLDENTPDDVFSLASYLGREQYGERPLFYGQQYTSMLKYKEVPNGFMPDGKLTKTNYKAPKQNAEEPDKYLEAENFSPQYEPNVFFPRMYSQQHAKYYESWMGGVEKKNVTIDYLGAPKVVQVPTFLENIRFFLSYQVNFMYWRYFMWNFAGRQNDIQGDGSPDKGNWITGFDAIDSWLIGADQSLLPNDLKENKGHNVFYCMPLLLGLLGIFWQIGRRQRGVQSFWVVFFLFFMTGLAIVLYLNQTPIQPRERDYAYAGSFYAFAIWIGMGVAALTHYISRLMKKDNAPLAVAAVVGLVCLIVPIQMAGQTWDDHDRSGRYVARDFGQNYMMSTQEEGNPILFCCGDNDTFPLWYNIETEGFRTDVRACNLSFLQTDWYVEQMKRPAYKSPALPLSLPMTKWTSIYRDAAFVRVRPEHKNIIEKLYAEHPQEMKARYGEDPFDVKNLMKYWVGSDDESMRFIPTDTVYIKVDKEAVKRSGMMIPDSIPDRMAISLKGKAGLSISDLAMLDMIANANWERPIYIAITVGADNFLPDLQRYFIQEGLAYRITPFASNDIQNTRMDVEKMYDNLVNKFKDGGVGTKGIYLDENATRICYTHQKIYSQLAYELALRGDRKRALEVVEKCEQYFPSYNIPYHFYGQALMRAETYYMLGETEKADRITDHLAASNIEYVTWYLSMNDKDFGANFNDVNLYRSLLHYTIEIMDKYHSAKLENYLKTANELDEILMERLKRIN